MKKATWLLVAGIFCYFIVTFVLNGAGECAEVEEKKPLISVPRVDFMIAVSRVWSGQHVGFYLLTRGNHQVVAYYDPEWRMTLAIRTLDQYKWDYYQIPDTPILGWSGHKNIVLAFDDDGYLHVSGNMHGTPLIYLKATKPYDIYSLERISIMVDSTNEKKCTYPQFERGASGEFIFHYRDGSSGRGNEIFNVYDLKTKTWRRYFDSPFIDGEGKRNAYSGLKRGPDGYFHLSWIWSDSPYPMTRHDPCYARSKDLLNWETIRGKPITLPITFETKGVTVEPVPVNSGFGVAGGFGFDSKNRPVITYMKFDENGNNQAYNARFENGQWKIYQTSDWNYRWYFHSFGAIKNEIDLYGVTLTRDGTLTQSYRHDKYGSGTWILDETTLKPTNTVEMKQYPEQMYIMEDHTGLMQINWNKDAGESGDPNLEYVLRWETLPPNYDRPREKIPKSSMLKLYGMRYGSQ